MQTNLNVIASRSLTVGALALVSMGWASLANGAIVALDINDKPNLPDVNDIANGGLYWNGLEDVNTNQISLKDSTGAASSFTAKIINSFGFGRENDPTPSGVIVAQGYRWPTGVQLDGGADNFSGRDGLAVVRFTVPVSSGLSSWSVAVMGGNVSSYGTWAANVGGTWGGSGNRTFIGGQTVFSSPTSGLSTGKINGITPQIVGSDYVVELQFGMTTATNHFASVLRGVVVEAVVPEPASLSLFALGALALRRRRRA